MIEKKQRSVGLNAVLSGIRSIFNVIYPLITFPYVSRVLQPDNLGKISFSQSLISYFSLIAALGITNYAIREGAKIRNDRNKIEKFATEIFSVNVITTIISLVALYSIVWLMPSLKSYSIIINILSISIIFTTFGAEWINSIYEDFLFITIRSIIIQIVLLILMFIFVKTPEDVIVYAVLLALSPVLIGISNRIYCRRYISIKFSFQCNFKKHIIPMLVFFASMASVTVYCNADLTMLGLIENDYHVGIYSLSVKIYNIIKGLLAAIIMVTIPRLSNYLGEGKNQEYNRLVNSTLNWLILILGPLIAGIIILARPIVMILGGEDFYASVTSLRILAVSLFFAIIGGIITNCINIPNGKEKVNLIATLVAAIGNVSLNFLLIPVLKENGAAFTTLIAEFLVGLVCIILGGDSIRLFDKKVFLTTFLHSIIGIALTISVWLIMSNVELNNVLMCLVVPAISIITYAVALFAIKDDYFLSFISTLSIKIRGVKNKR